MTKETLQLFREMLSQVRIGAYEKDCEAVWTKVRNAVKELEDELAK